MRPDPHQNVVFSPCSVMFCLAVMYEGATGETRQAIAAILEISGLDEHGRSFQENTHGKISRIVESLPPLAQIVALNAIYLKGAMGPAFRPIEDA